MHAPLRFTTIVLLTIIAALLAGLVFTWRAYQSAGMRYVRAQDARALARRTLTTLLDAETGQRGYLASSDERFLEPYRRAVHDWAEERRALERSAADLDLPPEKLHETLELAELRLDRLRESMLIRRADKPPEELVASMLRGKASMDDTRAGFAELDRAAEGAALRNEHAARRDSQWIVLLIAAAGFAVLLWAASSWWARRDLDARQQSAAERERLMDRFRVLTLSTSQMVWSTGPDGKVTEDSPSWRAFTGQTKEEWLGTGWLDAVHPDDREHALELWRAAVTTTTPYEAEYRVRRVDGTWAWTSARAAPILDAHGRVVEWIGSNADISARKEAQEEREAAGRAKDEFLAMLGHELRNPMAPIVTALQLMKLKGETRATRELEVIERQVGYMLRLVDDLLDISRITKRKIDLRKERLQLAAIVTKAVEMVMPIFEQRQHRLDVDVPPDLWLEADGVRMAQVLSNVLTNAAKYTDPGGSVRLAAAREGDELVVRITDDGIGISPEMLRTIFEPFTQGPRTIDRTQGGMGIGLALVRNLVELHGGTVTAHSRGLDQGSEFVIRLAAAPAQIGAAPKPAPAAPLRTQPQRILVVDDNADAAELLGELLRSAGHEVRLAHDGAAALRVWSEFSADLAILDIGLPVMDGYELAGRLREANGTAPRLIAVSGYGQERDRQRSADAGFEQHLVKPVDPAALLAAIDRS